MKRQYKILHGTHSEDGKYFIAGTSNNIIESDVNLALKYKNKFVVHVPRSNSDEDPDIEFLEPVDKGNGMFDVMDTRTGQKINNGYLTQEQAFEWCGLNAPSEARKKPEKISEIDSDDEETDAEADADAETETESEGQDDDDSNTDPLIS